jgi:hypothetical protein
MQIRAVRMLAAPGTPAFGSSSSEASMADYRDYAGRCRAPLPASPTVRDLVRFATLAANGHNTQPWRFRIERGAIAILPDAARRTPVVDPDDHHLFVSLGCAAETLAIAAGATGRPGEVGIDTHEAGIRYSFTDGPARPDPLLAAIPRRQSTRSDYDGRAIAPADLARLEQAAKRPGVRTILVADRPRISRIRDLVVAGNSTQMADPAFVRELKLWLRFNPRSAMKRGDGLFSAASGNPVLPTGLGRLAFDRFFTAEAENDRYARQIDTSSGIAVFVGDRSDRAHWIEVGRACQRFALTATRLGLKHAFVNQPVEVARLHGQLAALIGERGLRPDIVMRFGHGPTLPFSPRRSIDAVIL